MKKSLALCVAAIAVICVLTFSIGCKTAPAVVPEPAPVEPIAEIPPPSMDVPVALAELRTAAEAMRAKNIRYGIDAAEPELWMAAESDYNSASAAYGINNEESLRLYNDALLKFTELYENGLKRLNEGLVSSINDARKSAAATGADSFFPDEFAGSDEARSSWSDMTGSMEDIYTAGQAVLLRYQTLEQAGLAVILLRRIDTLEFAGYAQADYDAGIAALQETSAYLAALAMEREAFDSASHAGVLFAGVLNTGFGELALEERVIADNTKNQADSIKADISLKDRYAAASGVYREGTDALQSKENEKAYNAFSSAASGYTGVYQDALIKRNAAQKAIDDAQKKTNDADALAIQADAIAPLPDEEAVPEGETIEVQNETAAPVPAEASGAPAEAAVSEGGL